jgi:hypothetical protein
MNDIIVTTPLSEMKNAAKEAAWALRNEQGNPRYFRRFPVTRVPKVEPGDKVFYVEDGYIRGFCTIIYIKENKTEVTGLVIGKIFQPGIFVVMDAKSWTWIKPIPMKGFQGYRYTTVDFKYEEAGKWKVPRPKVTA